MQEAHEPSTPTEASEPAATAAPDWKKSTSDPTTATAWKKDKGPQPLDLPSGNTCLVQRKSLTVFLKAGLIPNELMPLVQKSLKGGTVVIEEVMDDPDSLQAMIKMMDTVCVECIKEPKVLREPKSEDDRDPDKLYVDEVDFSDKVAVYSYVIGGDVKEAGSFPDKQEGDVEPVPDGDDVPSEAVEPVGS